MTTFLISASYFILFSASSAQSYRAPLYFEPNIGQFDPQIRFAARGPVYRAWITDSELILEANAGPAARIRFAPKPKSARKAEGLEKQPGISNYFIGNRPERWTENVPSFAKAKIEEVYQGIDIVFYATPDQQIEYDLIVKPGADPSQISIDFDPRFKPRSDPGNTTITMDLPQGSIQHRVPQIHQNGRDIPYRAAFQDNSLTFDIGSYDRDRTLTLDPVVIYATYTGGALADRPEALAVDSTGAAYIAGQTKSADHPVLLFEDLPKFSTTDTDCLVTKFSPSGARVYSTYLGGESSERCTAIAVDATGAAYVAGATFSNQFPVRAAFQSQPGALFIAKLSATPASGSNHALVYSTYSQDQENMFNDRVAIAVDPGGSAYVASTTVRTTITTLKAAQTALGGNYDIVVLKVAATPTSGVYNRVYSTYLGGAGREHNPSIAVDAAGAAFVAGLTQSSNFPIANALQTSKQSESCSFVTKIAATPNGGDVYPFEYSTYLCGATNSNDQITAIAVDAASNAYVTGTRTSPDFPVPNQIPGSSGLAFLAKISGVKSGASYPLLFGSTFGGVYRATAPSAIAVSATGGIAAIAGESAVNQNEPFPAVDPPFEPQNPNFSAFAFKADTVNSAIVYSTLLGFGRASGVGLDSTGNTYVTGFVSNFSQDIYNGTPMPSNESAGFLMKLGTQPSPVTVNITTNIVTGFISFTVSGAGCRPATYTAPVSFRWPAGRSCTVTVADQETSAYRYLFQNWSDASTSTSRVITAGASPVSLQLNFEERYRLQITVSPSGAGTVTPAVTAFYPANSTVPLTATANAGFAFRGWIGASVIGNLSAASTNLTMTSPLQIIAQFGEATASDEGLVFIPVTPCRVADTRNPAGPLGQPALLANATRSFPIPTGPCGIPSSAAAYSLNVTVVPKTTLGYLSIWPSGTSQPVVSTLNSLDGRVKANAAIVPAGASGAVSVYVTDATELILDINGYFAPPPQNNGLAFYAVTPCRILDTRLANAALGGPSLAPAATRSIPIQQSNCGIPATAKAYSLNTTAVPPGPLGYVSLWPTGSTQPVVSTLNAVTGTIAANAAIVPAGSDASGSIDVFASEPTHLLIDVNGYFAPTGAANAQKFHTLTPCRIYDSRQQPNNFFPGPLATSFVNTYVFDIQPPPMPSIPRNPCPVSAAAQVYSLSATVIPTSGVFGYLTIYPDTNAGLPGVSLLNAIDGAITSNAAIVPAGVIGRINAYLTNPAHLLIDINGYFAP
jgi:hypothetical protein